jgi:integrase
MQAKIGNSLLSKLKPESKPYEVNDTEIRGFLLRVQPSGAISYYCSYRNRAGKRNRMSLGRHPAITPAQARDHARKVIASVVHGEDPALQKKVQHQHTLQTYLDDEYGPWVTANRKDGAATLSRIKSCFAEHLDLRLSELTPSVIMKWRTKGIAKGLKASTLNRDLASIKSALSTATEWGLVQVNPLQEVKMAKVDQNGIVRFLSDDEESRLRIALDEREQNIRSERDSANEWRRQRGYEKLPELNKSKFADHLKPMVLVSINTGIRQGELFNLCWESVDLERADLTVIGTIAKSGKTRHIPLNSEALETLKQWKTQHGSKLGLVFPSVDNKPFDNVKKSWHTLLTLAKIEAFRWHDLRHTFASKLVMRGVDLNTVRELLGHSDLKMTLRYAHLAPEHKAAAVEKLVNA